MQNQVVYRRRQIHILSPRQQDVLDAIVSYKRDHDGVAPTIRELMVAVDLNSTSAVSYHLDRLERKGYIVRQTDRPRTIEIIST